MPYGRIWTCRTTQQTCLTAGWQPEKFLQSDNLSLWLHGPSIMSARLETCLPSFTRAEKYTPNLSLKVKTFAVFTEGPRLHPLLSELERHSSFLWVLPVMAWVLPFVHTFCSHSQTFTVPMYRPLIPEEIECATLKIIAMVESTHFAKELVELKRGQLVSKVLYPLSPFVHSHGLLRVGATTGGRSSVWRQIFLARSEGFSYFSFKLSELSSHPLAFCS